MIFVFDTNILVSAILRPGSIPDQALNLAMKIGEIAFSQESASEVREVLSRDKFNVYQPKTERIKKLDSLISREFKLIANLDKGTCRDSKDLICLELAVSISADALVSGDKDLLELHPFQNIPILTATQFQATFKLD